MDFTKLLNQDIVCACGKTHRAPTKAVRIGPGVLGELPAFVSGNGFHRPLVVCDENTFAAAGKQVCTLLAQAGIDYTLCIPEGAELVADERAIDFIAATLPDDCDLLIGVGTGTINDLCKYVSFGAGLDYLIAATAPSMDGFTSGVAAVVMHHMKATLPAHAPMAVFGDTDVLCQAPAEMITAGVCDILGKNICLIDWQLGHLINGEYFCPYIYGLVRDSVAIVRELADDIRGRSPEAITRLMEALVLSGIAMSFCGNSRPASGCEHHLSHFWEMQFLAEGKKPVLHGLKVAVGTVAANFLYETLLAETPDPARAEAFTRSFDPEDWKKQMTAVFGDGADELIKLEEKARKNAPENQQRRLASALGHWDELRRIVRDCLPALEDTLSLLGRLNAPRRPADFGIDADSTRNAVLYAKEIRDRFTLLQLLWDLGLLPDYARKVTDFFADETRFQA